MSENILVKLDRLYLRELNSKDIGQMHIVLNNKEISDMMPMIPHPYPKEKVSDFINFISNRITTGESYELGIFIKNTDEYIGNVMLQRGKINNKECLVGYFLAPKYWGNGYTTEAMKGLIEYGKAYLNFENFIGRCMENNNRSINVMKRLGFIFKESKEYKENTETFSVNYYELL